MTRRATPRVTDNINKLATIIEETPQHPIGTIVRKKFRKGIHQGEVKQYNSDTEWYWIDYDNSDSEEMSHRQVQRYKCNDTNPDVVRIFTRSSL